MALTSGARLGLYEIVAPLGAGGMGEVFRARDTKLGRDVALKILPASVAEDPDRIARFKREAQVLAALNHPHIAAIYGFDEAGTTQFLVLELVEGETLADRLKRGPIPVDETIVIARQMAEALEEAHQKGIIHRDLKPANVAFTAKAQVKVLDFGLAKLAVAPAGAATSSASMSPTLTTPAMTAMGMILGTAAYMAPEQAKGREADKRSDLWAFGCVIYEMLTAKRAFEGEDITDTIASIMRGEPDWKTLPAETPANVRQLLELCLTKDRQQRAADIAVAQFLLGDRVANRPNPESPLPNPVSAWRHTLPWAVAAAALAAVAIALWAPWRETRPVEHPLVRLDVDLGSDVSLGSPNGADVIISPDGNRLAFVSQGRLLTRRLDQPKAVELAGTQSAFAPFFSPDGRWLAFFAGGQLKKISVEGGAAVSLCATQGNAGRGGSWSEDGTIVVSLDGITLSRLPDTGGAPAALTKLAEGEAQHRWPQFVPGGQAVLLTVRPRSGSFDEGHIDVLSMRDGSRKTVQRGGMFGRYLAASSEGGYLVYVSKGTVFGVPFDLGRLEVRGTPSPVLEDVGYSSVNGAAQLDASQHGTLVYRSGGSAGGVVTLQWLDVSGKTEPLSAKPGAYQQPHVSPDGSQLALNITTTGGQDIWAYDWRRDAMSRLTFGGGTFYFPVWHPTGRYIVFTGGYGGGGMFWTRADGAGKPQSLTQSKNGQFPWSFSPDGKRLAYADFPAGQSGDIWTVPLENDGTGLKAGKPEVFLQTPASELFPAFSPDGRWIAYRSNESGSDEIYVRPFPDKGGKWLISTSGGAMAVWSRNGRELFYRTADQHIMVVTYAVKGDVFVADKPRLWTETRLAETGTIQNLDIAADGKRFVALMPATSSDEQRTQNHVIFLQNFADEVQRRVGARR